MLFTTSWDDGHPLDLRTAEILERYSCTGTFYVCRDGQMGERLSDEQIRSIAERHEVGAHTLTHPHLPDLDQAAMDREIRGSKEWLEEILGRECAMFAYPYGAVNRLARDRVEAAGFKGARIYKDLSWDFSDPFMLPTSVQLHTFPFRPVMDRRVIEPLRSNWLRLRECGISLFQCRSWLSMAKAAFRFAMRSNQPAFHLWGHSWSTEKFGLWGDLEKFLQFVSEQPDVVHGVNGELVKKLATVTPRASHPPPNEHVEEQ